MSSWKSTLGSSRYAFCEPELPTPGLGTLAARPSYVSSKLILVEDDKRKRLVNMVTGY